MPKKEVAIKHTTILAAYILIIWGFYRFLFKLPEELEEVIIKPILWLVPVFFLLRKEKVGLSSIGITNKNLFSSIYFAVALGIIFAFEGLLINIIKYKGGVDFSANIGSIPLLLALAISFITAVSEELTFRGYIFGRLWSALGSEFWANLITSVLWALVHLPIAIFWWELNLMSTLGLLVLTTIFGVASAIIYVRTKNILASILLHVFWEWPIILFR
jgi:membrane protease YdiL (CAAX protease family)